MLIDASHPEETRVVIVNGTRIEELDFESAAKRQLRGNVYLARVTRVEPSLQAAFIEYGGDRQGFLAFSEIHPGYYQIPHEDRMALLKQEEEESKKDKDAEYEDDETETSSSPDPSGEIDEQEITAEKRLRRLKHRRYKIQEIIKRGQILLVQVVKEERGNKGVAMTTYLSLAGRYCVLMPKTPQGGGISRKISSKADRKRLKGIMADLNVPQSIGVIVRTAGATRTRAEIKRDYDYLCRLWETVRETTLKSIAPSLIHEESDLVKRSIRDLYDKDIKEVLVQGKDAYTTAKSFIKMLIPSHAQKVKAYEDTIPLFLRFQVEQQMESSLDPVVQLKSGGYLVIHPTEALVSIDINSGRSTRERDVESTALKTNLEAADEIARQIRIRDLAGLIVIDFIDMDEYRNNVSLEKSMRDALAKDRARVRAGKISQFGLMEISRQRRRRGLLESSTESCTHCGGIGRELTVESVVMRAIRTVENVGVRARARKVRLNIHPDIAAYIFNHKRAKLGEIESRFGMTCEILAQPEYVRADHEVEIIEAAKQKTDDPPGAIRGDIFEEAREDRKQSYSDSRSGNKGKNPESVSRDSNQDKDHPKASDSKPDSSDGKEERGTSKHSRGRRGGRRRKPGSASPENTAMETQGNTPEQDEDKVPEQTLDALKVINPAGEAKPEAQAEIPSPNAAGTSETETVEASENLKPVDTSRSTTRRKAPAKPETEAKAAPKAAPAREAAKEIVRISSTRRKAPAKEGLNRAEHIQSPHRQRGPGRHEEAIADLDEAIRLAPDHAEAWLNRGLAKGSLGQYEEAIADFDEAIRLAPDHAEAWLGRCAANGSLGRYKEAIADAQQAHSLARQQDNARLAEKVQGLLTDLKNEA